jgi:hypothetical protein
MPAKPNIKSKVNTAGGSPAASYLSCLAKKGNPKKAPPVCGFGIT